tara:strand:+ start:349 stop:705 length:357 start_codon:yes stop_codon:yes gene_type:complete
MFVTRDTDSLLDTGTIVSNESDPAKVAPYTTGIPVGVVLDAATHYDMDDPTVITGYSARVVCGPSTAIKLPASKIPPSYDGRIANYNVGANGVIELITDGSAGRGVIVGLDPTWITWG